MDVGSVVRESEKSGLIVEQESFDRPPRESVGRSLEYVKKAGLP
jgi:hypothetical protein